MFGQMLVNAPTGLVIGSSSQWLIYCKHITLFLYPKYCNIKSQIVLLNFCSCNIVIFVSSGRASARCSLTKINEQGYQMHTPDSAFSALERLTAFLGCY